MLTDVIRFTMGSASWALLFALMIAVGRILGPQEFGRFAWVLAYAFLFDPLLDAGFYRLTIRKSAVRPSSTGRYLAHSLLWKASIGVLVLAAFGFDLLPTSRDPRLASAVVLMVGAGILRSVKDALRSGLIGRGLYVRDVLSLGGERLALFAIGFWILWTGGGLTEVCVAFLIVRATATGATWFLARRKLEPIPFRVEPRFMKTMAASGALVAIAGVGLSLCGHLEVVLLGSLRHATEAGWYSAAHWIRGALLVVPGVMGAVLVPKLARRHHDDPAGFEELFAGGVKYACAAGMAITANGLLLAGDAVTLLFGEGFAPAADTLRILLLGLPAIFGIAFLQGSLLRIDRDRRVLGISIFGLIAHLGLGLALVPRFGTDGAAIATVAAETALFLGFYAAVRRRMPGVAGAVFLKAPAALASAAVVAWLSAGHGLIVQLAWANAIFASALLFSGFVGASERRAMLAALHRKAAVPVDSRVRVE